MTKGQSPELLRLACAAAIVKISEDSQAGLPIMLEALQSAVEPTRLKVLQSLGESGPSANEAALVVVKCLGDKSAPTRVTTTACGVRVGGFVLSALRIAAPVIESALRVAKSAYHEVIARKLKLGYCITCNGVNQLLLTPNHVPPNPK